MCHSISRDCEWLRVFVSYSLTTILCFHPPSLAFTTYVSTSPSGAGRTPSLTSLATPTQWNDALRVDSRTLCLWLHCGSCQWLAPSQGLFAMAPLAPVGSAFTCRLRYCHVRSIGARLFVTANAKVECRDIGMRVPIGKPVGASRRSVGQHHAPSTRLWRRVVMAATAAKIGLVWRPPEVGSGVREGNRPPVTSWSMAAPGTPVPGAGVGADLGRRGLAKY